MKQIKRRAISGSCFLTWLLMSMVAVAQQVPLIVDSEAVGVVVIADDLSPDERQSVEYFTNIVEQSTGVRLPVVMESDESTIASAANRLYIGNTEKARQVGLLIEDLPEEGFRLFAQHPAVYLLASKARRASGSQAVSRPLRWGLNRILEQSLGVRWLWPGELGTYVPSSDELVVVAQDEQYQPDLMVRSMRMSISDRHQLASADHSLDQKLRREALDWAENHQSGRRGQIRFGHAFSHWWDKYSAEYPDYFAEPPPGVEQIKLPGRVKLRLSNPAVIEQIAVEYQEAGAPDYYNVCPNDGTGFDVSKETLAWDIPRDQDVNDIWRARGEQTARYVKFWNLLYDRLKEINPNVQLSTYAYSSYRNPPPAERPLTARLVIAIVDTYDNYAGWQGWADTGSSLFLRPNWWHQGGNAPYLPLEKTHRFIQFATDNGMVGIDMDSVIGYWSTQGINYYMVARLMTRPELDKQAILDEYTAAFGPAAKIIESYILYWEGLADEYNYPINAGGGIRPASVKSKYEDLVREGTIGLSILNGSKYALPWLYGEDVVAPAEKMLDEAAQLVQGDLPEYAARVEFLRAGLDELRMTRDLIALGQRLKNEQTADLLAAFKEGAAELERTREQLAEQHIVWAEAINRHENRYRVLIRPDHLASHHINLEGL